MALYYPPVKPNSPIYSYQNFAAPNTPVSPAQGGSTVTEEWLATHYLQFPNAQGVENFGFQELQLTSSNAGEEAQLYINPNAGVDVVLSTSQTDGSLTIKTPATTLNTMVLSPSTGITFGDLTTQNTAFIEANYAQLNTNNTFLSPYINTFQGSNATLPSTGPLQISNVSTSEYASFFVDPSPTYDLTLYTAQTGNTAGLTVRNPNYSFSVNPTANNTATFVNPISTTYSITGGSLGISTTGQDTYSIYSNSTGGYGLVLANTTGNNGSLTLSNNGGNLTTLTCSAPQTLNYNGGSITGLLNLTSIYSYININSAISMASGQAININNSALYLYDGVLNTNIYFAGNQCSFNNGGSYAGNAGFNFALNDSTSSLQTVLNIASAEIDSYTNLNMNSKNILNIGTGSTAITQPIGTNNTTLATTAFVIANQATPVLTNYAQLTYGSLQTFTGPITFSGNTTGITQPINTNNTTLATTAYVLANGAIYTTSTFTNNTGTTPYASISPSPCTVVSTYIPQTTVVNFDNVNFTVSIINNPLFIIYICSLTFSTAPFPGSPPATTSGTTTILYNNTNTVYSTPYSWSNATTLIIQCPTALQTLPSFNGVSFTINLQNLGGFKA